MEKLLTIIGFIVFIIIILIISTIKDAIKEAKAAKEEHEKQKRAYNFTYDENGNYKVKKPEYIGGTFGDKFFVDCVMSGCTDFSKPQNREKADILAKKYNVTYTGKIEDLYKRTYEAHKKLYADIKGPQEKTDAASAKVLAEKFGRDKRIAMLTDLKDFLLGRIGAIEAAVSSTTRSVPQQKELSWGLYGGMANSLGGAIPAMATILDVQKQNEQIRSINREVARDYAKILVLLNEKKMDLERREKELQKKIEITKEKLIGKTTPGEIMEKISFSDEKITVTETGAIRVSVKAKVNGDLFIYDDVKAIVDGTIAADIFCGNQKVGRALMVLPVDGISSFANLEGILITNANENNVYTVKFSPYKLWLIEK